MTRVVSNLHHCADRFMRGSHGNRAVEFALPDLQVGMTEPCRLNLYQELIGANSRDVHCPELIGFVELAVLVTSIRAEANDILQLVVTPTWCVWEPLFRPY